MAPPTIYRFLQRYSKLGYADELRFYLAQYIWEIQMLTPNWCKYEGSKIAAGSFYFAGTLLKSQTLWNKLLNSESGYS